MQNWTFMLLSSALHVAFWALVIGGTIWLVLRLSRRQGTPASRGWSVPVGIAFIVVGLAVALITATMRVGSEAMDSMMGGHMAEMMGGETERRAPAPRVDTAVEQVTGGDFFIHPNEIRAPSEESVNIRFTNGGRMFHTFTVEELDFDLRARPGATVSGALRDVKPGTHRAICTVPGHAQAGMRATITVTQGS